MEKKSDVFSRTIEKQSLGGLHWSLISAANRIKLKQDSLP